MSKKSNQEFKKALQADLEKQHNDLVDAFKQQNQNFLDAMKQLARIGEAISQLDYSQNK